jgi:bifunctional UDP-N-acetylglucosamine pyrophosphorylase/glucosamine-1-phosphate N-acetyltransferase
MSITPNPSDDLDPLSSAQGVILAAGKGTRMVSERPKVLHEVLGRPMIGRVVDTAFDAGLQRVIVVVGYGADEVKSWLRDDLTADRLDRMHFVEQTDQLGTGHAVLQAEPFLESDAPEFTAVLSGDAPLMRARELNAFVSASTRAHRPLALMTARLDDPTGYGRVVRDDDGEVRRIVEQADANGTQLAINEVNTGFYVGETTFFEDALPELCSGEIDNAQGEYYLTDLIERAAEERGVFGWAIDDPAWTTGVNTRADLAEATATAREHVNHYWLDRGVTFIDPSSTCVETTVELDKDVVLHPNVELRGETRVESGTVVERGSVVHDTHLGPDIHCKANCYLEDAVVGAGTQLGPFAHLRPGADIGQDCKVGNYVEVKKATLEDGVKAGHLTYIGDAHLGEQTNVGAGTITCNYDGQTKQQTDVGREAFIGSNASLVAPVDIGDGAYIGAGSTITQDVPDRALAVGRGRQRNIENWAETDADDEDNNNNDH